MICGNDPRVRMTPGDRAMVDWFREWLAWDKTPAAVRGPEPAAPDGRRPHADRIEASTTHAEETDRVV